MERIRQLGRGRSGAVRITSGALLLTGVDGLEIHPEDGGDADRLLAGVIQPGDLIERGAHLDLVVFLSQRDAGLIGLAAARVGGNLGIEQVVNAMSRRPVKYVINR